MELSTKTITSLQCRDHPYKWDKHQLGEWLKSVALTDVASVFDSHQVNGENLRTMW